jgi:hypothetical protein
MEGIAGRPLVEGVQVRGAEAGTGPPGGDRPPVHGGHQLAIARARLGEPIDGREHLPLPDHVEDPNARVHDVDDGAIGHGRTVALHTGWVNDEYPSDSDIARLAVAGPTSRVSRPLKGNVPGSSTSRAPLCRLAFETPNAALSESVKPAMRLGSISRAWRLRRLRQPL